jgi:uncharacterized ParB-like nuclease family protein
MAELRAPEQNRLLGQLANMLRTTEGDIAAPEFLPRGLDVMGLVRQLMLPSAETVEKLSYGDPLFRMPTQSNIPITADREYLAEVLGMAPAVPAASRATTRLSNEAADQLVRAITRNPEATAPQVLEAAGQMLPLSRMISPEVAAKALPNTKAVKNDEPVMLYSGSQNEIQQFDDRSGIAFPAWFTDRPDVASAYAVDPTRAARGERSPTVYPSYLDLQNPLVLDAKGAKWNNIKIRDKNIADELEIDAPVSTTFLAYAARQKGYDGVIIKNVKDNPNAEVSGVSDVYVPFNPEQIRSATGDPQMAGLLDQPAQSVVENPFQTAFTQVSPGDEVAGLTVREYVPNIDSISASLENYEVLSGIRRVPARAFDAEYLDSLRAGSLDKRTADLSEQIKQSKEINPLIVAVDSKGAYIIEGGHRFDALMIQGRESVPAKVVIDQDDPPTEDFLRSLFQ